MHFHPPYDPNAPQPAIHKTMILPGLPLALLKLCFLSLLMIACSAGTLTAGTLTITHHPEDSNRAAGAEAVFEVVVEPQDDVQYQWLHNGDIIPGQTDSFMIMSSPQIVDVGYYSVRVQRGSETLESRKAKLTLTNRNPGMVNYVNSGAIVDVDALTPLTGSNYVAQLLVGPKSNLLAVVGSEVHLSTTPGIFYGGILAMPTIPPGSNAFAKIQVWDSRAGKTYEQGRANGKYGESKVVGFVAGTQTGTTPGIPAFSLYELGKPKIASQPSPRVFTTTRGSNITFTALATGELPLTYRWYFNGTLISTATEPLLRLNTLQIRDSGSYLLQVSNGLGQIWMRESTLAVYDTNRAPGMRSTSFSIGTGPDQPVDYVTIQRDGKILVAGRFTTFDGFAYANLARLQRDGAVDITFNPPKSGLKDISTVWEDREGHVYLGLGSPGSAQNVLRLNSDGSLDAGYRFSDKLPGTIYPFPDSGSFLFRTNGTTALPSKYGPDGKKDSIYVVRGISNMAADQIVPQLDGSVLINSQYGSLGLEGLTASRHIVRLGPTGLVDTNFPERAFRLISDNGRSSRVLGVSSSGRFSEIGASSGSIEDSPTILGSLAFWQVFPQSNGKRLAVFMANGFGIRNYLGRYLPSGDVDPSFTPILLETLGFVSSFRRAALLTDGNILLFGGRTGSSAVEVIYGDFEQTAPAMRSVRRLQSGTVSLTFEAQPDMAYKVQRSPNLKDWADFNAYTAVSNTVRVTIPSTPKEREFYRAVLQ